MPLATSQDLLASRILQSTPWWPRAAPLQMSRPISMNTANRSARKQGRRVPGRDLSLHRISYGIFLEDEESPTATFTTT
eukprot:3997433-Pleurochrysis_carterae.AAC.1